MAEAEAETSFKNEVEVMQTDAVSRLPCESLMTRGRIWITWWEMLRRLEYCRVHKCAD